MKKTNLLDKWYTWLLLQKNKFLYHKAYINLHH